ncbi:MAG: ribosome biogenesis GTP-binding protein YihA/YsxC [Bacillota bacterium]|jgi:GTP-binding protein
MQIKSAQYEVTAVNPSQYPARFWPEIAWVGRSNVGKSSLINALLNRKNLARVADTPGKTRVINFYNINDQFYLVDLPGYGYAKVSKAEKAAWTEMIETYLTTREQLQMIVMLVDIRHAPSADDRLMYDWLVSQAKPKLIVATKADKVPVTKVAERLREIRATLGMPEAETLIPFSAVSKLGRNKVWEQIRAVVQK